MPERGGPTTQSGILYQNSVTALYLGRLCDVAPRPESQQVVHVRVEAPENVDDTVVTFTDEHRVFIQAKENITCQDDAWAKLWLDIGEQFQNSDFQMGSDRLLLHVGNVRPEHGDLRELCERARTSKSYAEWQSRITKTQKQLVDNIKKHLAIELLDDETLLRFFAHIGVEIWALSQIERDLVRHWMPETTVRPMMLFRLLRDRVGGMGRVRGSFDAHSLRKDLEQEDPSLQFVTPSDIENLRISVKSASSLLRQHRHTIATTGIHIPRAIVTEVVTWVQQEVEDLKNVAMLTDQAGMGKTVVLRDALCELEALGVDTLAIKADQQLSEIKTLSDIQQRLELAQSVVETVERLAKLNRVVVLIDQVDALSLSLAHDQQTLNVVLDLIARLRRIANVRIVISCRLFDRNSDHRLKQMTVDQQFTLSKLSDQEIETALASVNVSFKSLPKPTQELLRTPLHLDLFALAVENNDHLAVQQGINSLQELYNCLWNDVIRRYDPYTPSPADCEEVLYRLTDYMHHNQRISAPHSILETTETRYLQLAVHWLASVGILIRGNAGWSLLHQTFFDYCYARRFVERGRDIVAEILDSDQGLFVRPQLIQVMSYLRGTDPNRYIQALNHLLNEPRLRYHLRDLLLRWFGALSDPTDDEWLLAQRILIDPARRHLFLSAVSGNPRWFDRVRETYLQSWLNDGSIIDTQVIPYLASLVDVAQTEVIKIVEPLWNRSEEWVQRTRFLLSSIRRWYSMDAIGLFEQYMNHLPTLDRLPLYDLAAVARAHPPTICRLVHQIFDHVLAQYLMRKEQEQKESGENDVHLFGRTLLYSELGAMDHSQLAEVITVVSQADPKLFLDLMLPWLEKALVQHRPPRGESSDYYFFDELSHNWYGNTYKTQYAFIHGLITALITVARSNPDDFRERAALLASWPYETPQQLLTHLYRAVPEVYAHDACAFLVADPRRLDLGDSEQYDSRQVIKAIYPYLNATARSQLETHILSYAPVHKHLGINALRWRGIEQITLLQVIPEPYLSPAGIRKLREWERKFPGFQASENPLTARGGVVGSPIPSDCAQRMSDKSWLRAMRKYQKGVQHEDFLKGGAHQLSQVLENMVKEEPERFYQLFCRVPDDIDDAYVMAFMNGFAESTAPAEWLYAVIRQFAVAEDRDLKRAVAWAIEKRVSDGIPADIVDLLQGYVHEKAGDDEWWWSKGKNHGDVHHSYLNSDRGSAYRVLMRIQDHDATPEAIQQKWRLIELACADKSTALRVGAIHGLVYMIRHDHKRAISCFRQLVSGHELLLASELSREFLYWAMRNNFLVLEPYIRDMMYYPEEATQKRGAELVCIAALSPAAFESEDARQAAEKLVEDVMTGPPAWRRGAAHIYAHNIARDVEDKCLPKLMALLGDDDGQVQQLIGSVFFDLDASHFFTLRAFMEEYVHSIDIPEHQFLKYLWKHGLLDPTWTLAIICRIINQIHAQPQGFYLSGIDELIRLVLQIYRDPTTDSCLRQEAMDVFDELIHQFEGQVRRVLSEWDSR